MKTKENKNVIDEIRFNGKTRTEALCELYSTLSNDDLIDLMSMAHARMFVYPNESKTTYDIESICTNGNSIQINLIED